MTAEPTSEADSQEAAVVRDDASAWLEQHGDALYCYARARLGARDLAEDLVQETLLAALEARQQFAGRSSVRTWLFSILRHKIVDFYRRGGAGGQPTGHGETLGSANGEHAFFTNEGFWRSAPSSWKSPEEAFLDDEFWSVLDGCLGGLPRPLAQAFMLRELEQIEAEELCKILDLSPGNLRVRLHRARLLLRDCLEKQWFGSRSDEAPRSQ
jgi:RNA polymerase sigma-70 factor (ECF subfamily)